MKPNCVSFWVNEIHILSKAMGCIKRNLFIVAHVFVKEVSRKMRFRMENIEIRINKFLSEAGVCSRREADRKIESRRIKI